jgi:hypothetical protein
MPIAKAWRENAVHYAGDIVVCDGATWQARTDTGTAPGSPDWTCLACSGVDARPLHFCGAYKAGVIYEMQDVCVVGGSSFVATRDNPGDCPGANWVLLAGVGKRGVAGPRGERGERGSPGERGRADADAPIITSWHREGYIVIPMDKNETPGFAPYV